jgi:5-methylthioadenosine/S-adenosylhomocysteine deaminase
LLSRAASRTKDECNQATAAAALFAATRGGARALGIDDQTGSLSEGLQADLTVIGLTGVHQQPVRDPVEALIFSSSARDTLLTIVAGNEIYSDGVVKTVDEERLRSELQLVTDIMSA